MTTILLRRQGVLSSVDDLPVYELYEPHEFYL